MRFLRLYDEGEAGGNGGGDSGQQQTKLPTGQEGQQQQKQEVQFTAESTLTVDGNTFKVGDLLASQQKAKELEEYRARAGRLIQGSGELTEEREADLRFVLAQEGYQPQDVEGYIQFLREEQGGHQVTQQGPQQQQGNQQQQGQGEYRDPRVDQLLARMDATDKRVSEGVLESLERRLEESVSGVLDSHGSIGLLLERTDALDRGDEEALQKVRASRRDAIREAVQEQTLAQVQARRNRGETYRPEWFAEEAGKAADAVFRRYQTVFGDPQMLGRAPDSGADPDANQFAKPPEDPKFEMGDEPGDVYDKARNLTEGTLLHLAHQIEQGGKGKV